MTQHQSDSEAATSHVKSPEVMFSHIQLLEVTWQVSLRHMRSPSDMFSHIKSC